MKSQCIACGILKNELTLLHDEGFLPTKPEFIASRMHMDPVGLDQIIQKATNKPDTRISLIYGDCCPSMLDISARAEVVRPDCINCCELLLGKETYRDLLREGAFFLLPEWLENWREIFEVEMGLSPEVARDLMAGQCLKLIFLDTGITPIPHQKIKECSEFIGLNVEVMQVGLENLKTALIEADIAEKRS